MNWLNGKEVRRLLGVMLGLVMLVSCGGKDSPSASDVADETSAPRPAFDEPEFPEILTDVNMVVLIGYFDANQDASGKLWPTAVDLVRSSDERVLAKIGKLSASEWFEQKEVLLDDHPKLEINSWEVVPGQLIVVASPDHSDHSQEYIDSIVASISSEDTSGMTMSVIREQVTLYEKVGGFLFANYHNQSEPHRYRLGVGGVLEVHLERDNYRVLGDPALGFWGSLSPF